MLNKKYDASAAPKNKTYCKMQVDKHGIQQGWGQVQYLYLSTYLSVLAVLEYLVYGNVKVLVLDQKVLGTYK